MIYVINTVILLNYLILLNKLIFDFINVVINLLSVLSNRASRRRRMRAPVAQVWRCDELEIQAAGAHRNAEKPPKRHQTLRKTR